MKTYKFCFTVPVKDAERMRRILGDAWAGKMGDYTHCSFSISGIGRFYATEKATPSEWDPGEFEAIAEEYIQMDVTEEIIPEIKKIFLEHHPYEEPWYEFAEKVTFDDVWKK